METMGTPFSNKAGLLDPLLVNIARELAANIQPLETILGNHGVSLSQWNNIVSNPVFSDFLLQATAEWASAINGTGRVSVKCLAIVESSLPHFYASLIDQSIPLVQRTDLLKALGKFAKLGEDGERPGTGGNGFSLTITIGDKNILVGGRAEPSLSDVANRLTTIDVPTVA